VGGLVALSASFARSLPCGVWLGCWWAGLFVNWIVDASISAKTSIVIGGHQVFADLSHPESAVPEVSDPLVWWGWVSL
jgi:hypothetical protein